MTSRHRLVSRLSPVHLLLLAACGLPDEEAIVPLPEGALAEGKADADGDGYDSSVDCDDGSASVHPGATELDNLVDEDCDDWVDEDFLVDGDIVITEINKRSQGGTGGVDNDASWVEVYNRSSRDVSMSNWAMVRGISSFQTVYVDPDAAPVIGAGGYAVICDSDDYEASGTAAYPLACDYVWGDESQPSTYQGTYHNNTYYLRRDSDQFAMYINGSRTTGTLIDAVTYYYDATNGYWSNYARYSLSLDPMYADVDLNDEKDAWCATSSASTGVPSPDTTWRWYDTPASTKDEYGTPGAENYDCLNDPDLDGDGYTGASDCDDGDADINPGAAELCDGIDNNCDDIIDDAGGYTDVDGDGYGDPAAPSGDCEGGTGVANNDDCDDTDASINPDTPESDDGTDEDCDGWVDEDFVAVGDVVISEVNKRSTFNTGATVNNGSWVEIYNASSRTVDLSNWVIARGTSSSGNQISVDPSAALTIGAGEYAVLCDSDDYEASAVSFPLSCDYVWGDETQASGYVGTYHDNTFYIRSTADTFELYIEGNRSTGTKIDGVSWASGWPSNSRFSLTLDPFALDATDNDTSTFWCSTTANGSGAVAGSTTWRWYNTSGTSLDEYGTPGAEGYDCVNDLDGDGYTTDDCDDSDASINPGATELCDGVDNDCDGSIDEGSSGGAWYADSDGDTYGDASVLDTSCTQPSGYVADDTDCDDTDATINPGEAEVCGDGIDQDCDPTSCEYSGSAEIKAAYDFRAYGTAASYAVGQSVADNGDFDGDGNDDAVVGQSFHDTSPATDNGRINLWYGPVDTSDSLTSADLTIDGATAQNNDQFGGAARFMGDVNGDTMDDLMASAIVSGTSDNGTAYLFYGGGTPSSVSGADASFTVSDANNYVGQSVDGGDMTGDSLADVAIGAYGRSSSAGAVGVWAAGDIGGGAESLSTTATLLISGEAAGDNLGYSVAVGDLNGDGNGDLILGAPAASSTTAAGKVYLFLDNETASGSVSASTADAILTGTTAADRLGLSVSFLGDSDGDGQNDFVVSADKTDTVATDAGSAYVITTVPSGTTAIASAFDTRFTGEVASDFCGRTVAGVGDSNGDALGDLMIGATGWDKPASWSGGGSLYFFYGPYDAGTVSVSNWDAQFTGANNSDAIGYTVSGGGDVNNDGYADWMAGAPSWDGFGFLNSGGSWLYYGGGE